MAVRHHETAIILFWFDDHLKSFVAFCKDHNVPATGAEEWTSPSVPEIVILDANTVVNSLSIAMKLSEQAKKGKMVLLFDGHYPLTGKETILLEKIKGWNPDNTRLTFCQSLDSAFFKQFVGDKLLPLLEQLGLKDDECLEHAMIAKSITNAREKLSKSIIAEMTSHSEADWFSRNKLTA